MTINEKIIDLFLMIIDLFLVPTEDSKKINAVS